MVVVIEMGGEVHQGAAVCNFVAVVMLRIARVMVTGGCSSLSLFDFENGVIV